MINYTERLTLLMADIVARVPALSFIDIREVLVFARAGRSQAEGAFATCHCLTLPSEPGYCFWCDRSNGRLTRRSEWFVTKSPVVDARVEVPHFLRAAALLRSVVRPLAQGAPVSGRAEPWIAKLDTIGHELCHIDPELSGIRRIERKDGSYSANCHGNRFLELVVQMVHAYVNSRPDPAVYNFLQSDFGSLGTRHGGVFATTFRTFPSFPQRYIERWAGQPPCQADSDDMKVESLRVLRQPTRYSEDDLHVRQFMKDTSQVMRKGQFRAA